jgi:predicted transcriptional regulator of viral defense system
MKEATIISLLRSKASVFTFKELLIASGQHPDVLKNHLHYYVKKGDLYAIRRGLYAKDKNYDRRELATKIFIPSYISFETCLVEAGIIFQHYTTIFVASYQSREIICDGQTYLFRKLKDSILTNPAGIEQKETYSIASKERAFLDLLYLNTDYYFDNLAPLDVEKIKALLPLYDNKKMIQRVQHYLKTMEGDNHDVRD